MSHEKQSRSSPRETSVEIHDESPAQRQCEEGGAGEVGEEDMTFSDLQASLTEKVERVRQAKADNDGRPGAVTRDSIADAFEWARDEILEKDVTPTRHPLDRWMEEL